MLFAIDDSEIEIEGRPHTILATIGVENPPAISSALSALKTQFGLSDSDEVKWNGMKPMSAKAREALSQELMVLLHDSIPLVSITEGRDKQEAARNLATQISDYYLHNGNGQTEPAAGLELMFDESILSDTTLFREFLETLCEPLRSAIVTSVHSHEHAVIQLADILAGFNRLATGIAVGRVNKDIKVWDDGLSDAVEIDLLGYISTALRWPMWGVVPQPPDPDNPVPDGTWPFKHVGGYGLRIHSTIPSGTIAAIYDSRVVYMGCMH
jgi:hypothetical protein